MPMADVIRPAEVELASRGATGPRGISWKPIGRALRLVERTGSRQFKARGFSYGALVDGRGMLNNNQNT
jgi:hypothetical protein